MDGELLEEHEKSNVGDVGERRDRVDGCSVGVTVREGREEGQGKSEEGAQEQMEVLSKFR